MCGKIPGHKHKKNARKSEDPNLEPKVHLNFSRLKIKKFNQKNGKI